MGVWIETISSSTYPFIVSVTPFVGVWIETEWKYVHWYKPVSHPSWVCGLKPSGCRKVVPPLLVTPFVGVWIETPLVFISIRIPRVTPFVGVWIETSLERYDCTLVCVTPFVGVWIETLYKVDAPLWGSVTPFVGVWIETQNHWVYQKTDAESHPSWVCGLKQDWCFWLCYSWSHTLRGCVDWNSIPRSITISIRRHTLRGCVDWNSRLSLSSPLWSVTPFVGVWIETSTWWRKAYQDTVTPFVGVWIETTPILAIWAQTWVTPFVGVWIETENRFYFLSPLEKVIFTKTCHWLSISYKDKKYDSGLF